MSDYPDLDAILTKSSTDWTPEDYKVIDTYNRKLGRAKVKSIRDELNDTQNNELVPIQNGQELPQESGSASNHPNGLDEYRH